MKTILPLVFCLAVFYATPGHAQLKEQCATCFTSEISKSTKIDSHCTDYEIKVFYSGQCEHALSHFTVEVPDCYAISNLANSDNYPQEIGYDPTTGLTGFKIESTLNFGSTSEKYFTVSFRLCANSSSCSPCWKPAVAYKAGNCYELDSLKASCSVLKAHLDTKNTSCFGSVDGQVSVVIDDGVPPYQYSWSNGSVNSSVPNLGAGSYSVVIKDATGSQLTLSATLTQPPAITITPTITQASCSGQSDGSIVVSVTGGTGPPYTYSWNDGTTASSLTDLKADVYSILVKDPSGCSVSEVFNVTNQKQLTLSASQVRPACTQSDGSLSISASGGTEPYTFIWSNDSTSSTISKLTAGTYSVMATDAEGCSISRTYSLQENNTLSLGYTVTPTTCLDNASGAIDLSVTGGTAPYTYAWSTGATTQDISNLTSTSAGYTVIVTDSLGCQLTTRTPITISKNTFDVNATITQPLCWGESTGSISLTTSGGTSPYQFAWSNGATAALLTDLAAGSYSVTITDATGCSKTLPTYAIFNPSQLTVASVTTIISCNVYSIDLAVSGGTSPYSYLWATGEHTQGITGVASGTYSVTITDANGCTINKQIVIDNTGSFTCAITPPSQSPLCLSGNNKIFTTTTDASYQWQVTSTDGSWQVQSGATSDTLVYAAGNQNTSASFTLTIAKNGCTQSCTYTIASCAPTTDTGGGNNESCNDCFKSTIIKTNGGESCASYEVTISTDGNCRYDLSHLVIAIPCGDLSDYSDSGNWPLVIGRDPTTGLTGLKVDNVSAFGKVTGSFILKFTVCFDSECGDQLKNWNPVVAYKAGLCVAYDTLNILSGSASSPYPNPFKDTFSIDVSSENDEIITVELFDQFGRAACEPSTYRVTAGDKASIKIDASSLPQNIYLYKVHTSTNVLNGRIVKSN